MKDHQTKHQYLDRLRDALQARGLKDVNDIIEDYEEYFEHSTAKGYSIAESIRRLPPVKELAASYEVEATKQPRTNDSAQLSRSGRWSLFAMVTLSELVILPFALVAGLLLACIGLTGVLLFFAGLLMALPESILGNITVPHPPLAQLLPAMALFMTCGIAIAAATLIITERVYSALRKTIILKRWMLTGKHDNYLKLVPSVSKRTRTVLYKTALSATFASTVALLLLVLVASITTGSPDFLSNWNI